MIEAARTALYDFNRKTVLFLDEIHRFSKAQQDALLPAVENGWLILVAATTENPSFSVIPPLLSRSLIVELAELAPADIQEIIQRAVVSPRGLAGLVELQPPAAEQIVRLAQGDARRALTLLEAAALSAIGQAETAAAKEASTEVEASGSAKPVVIDLERVEAVAAAAAVRYDRAGDSHYDIISAFIKSVRGSDADAAIHYLARMLVAGEDPRFIARRLMILAAEDIGLADPQALVLATATANCVALIGMPEGRIPLAETTIYLALAPKSNSAYTAINSAMADVQGGLTPPVPGPLRGASYSGAARLGRGKGYVYPHDDPAAVVPQQYVGAGAAAKAYYKPRVFGFEQSLVQRWERLRQIIRAKK